MTDVVPPSLDGSANTLLELAGLLQAGRPELTLSGRVATPAAHEEVAGKTKAFAEFAHDQYEDVVALLAALATKLKAASASYTAIDAATQRKLDDFLVNSTYRAA